MPKLLYSLNNGVSWTYLEGNLPLSIPSTASQTVLVDPLGDGIELADVYVVDPNEQLTLAERSFIAPSTMAPLPTPTGTDGWARMVSGQYHRLDWREADVPWGDYAGWRYSIEVWNDTAFVAEFTLLKDYDNGASATVTLQPGQIATVTANVENYQSRIAPYPTRAVLCRKMSVTPIFA